MEKAKKLAEKIVDDHQLTARTKMRAIASDGKGEARAQGRCTWS